MRRAVDAAGEAGHHDKALDAQLARKAAGEALTGGGGDARPHHGDGWLGEETAMAQRPQGRRRGVEGGEALGIVRIAHHQEAGASLGRQVHLSFGVRDAQRSQRARSAAAARQFGQGGESPLG